MRTGIVKHICGPDLPEKHWSVAKKQFTLETVERFTTVIKNTHMHTITGHKPVCSKSYLRTEALLICSTNVFPI